MLSNLRPIPGFKNYLISRDGHLYSKKSGKLLKPSLKKNGYLQVVLYPKRKTMLLHRLVALTYLPNPNNKREVNHINGIKTDNRVENLKWVSPRENQIHSINNGFRDNVVKALQIANSIIRIWHHRTYGVCSVSIRQLIALYPEQELKGSCLSNVATGKRQHHKGWRIEFNQL